MYFDSSISEATETQTSFRSHHYSRTTHKKHTIENAERKKSPSASLSEAQREETRRDAVLRNKHDSAILGPILVLLLSQNMHETATG